jgi:antitoxin component HigA of HigAB toxin-antitoxin module
LNKADFAKSIGLSKSNYRQVEVGARLLTVGQIYTLYMTHGVPMEYLLTGQQSSLPSKFKP